MSQSKAAIASAKYKKAHPERRKEQRMRCSRKPLPRFNRVVYRAKDRGLEWNLTFDEWFALISRNCYYCNGSVGETGCGLDRLYYKQGYAIGNVVPCCKICNFKKGILERLGFTYPRTVELLKELLETKRVPA